ncbi:tRNA (cytosine(38)-C(5))-methyltransferase isoform X2 [Alligator sinensis]|uniref:tRNA (Cytosine(38)-C(5))-methyltransferase isoform X2 n=1 Tax=Alligator sinensis TaxID=38654 RepID=A0A3Q0HPM3_ALLSI|nr:tRNA (cytosine(38)-C(5))-methyltransferase isoform X2 [Alligator sinensis]
MILMSPPCQPFTRIGLQGDVSDPRTKSFIYILDILPRLDDILIYTNARPLTLHQLQWSQILMQFVREMFHHLNVILDIAFHGQHKTQVILPCSRLERLPKYILLENVKGFETSSARNEFVQTLEACGFKYQEFLLSPTCLGIPNSRLRYFLIAKLHSEPFSFQASDQILTYFPDQESNNSVKYKVPLGLEKDNSSTLAEEENLVPNSGFDCGERQCSPKEAFLFKLETMEEMKRKQNQDNDFSMQVLKDFLEGDSEKMSQYYLPPKSLLRYAFLLDIVKPTCRRSTCFTKGYGHYVEGTGSVLQTAEDVQLESVFKFIETLSEEEKLKKLSTLKLRYFTPREIANLHGFPPEFGFPDKITVKQRYRLLGNSLNVHIVAKLISLLIR